ncbi:MAG: hypothetical protein AB2L14_12045 [Candidatus Xenobiia bacterium LiM19]
MSADDKASSETEELFRKGYDYLNESEFDRAIGYFYQALEISPEDAIVLAGRGFALIKWGQLTAF